jgi:hypothetical protein
MSVVLVKRLETERQRERERERERGVRIRGPSIDIPIIFC